MMINTKEEEGKKRKEESECRSKIWKKDGFSMDFKAKKREVTPEKNN